MNYPLPVGEERGEGMSWKANADKIDRINRFGQTVDLPLFENPPAPLESPEPPLLKGDNSARMPDWIWDGSSVKAEVYDELKEKFAEDSVIYLKKLIEVGGRASDNEIMNAFNNKDKWPLAIVSARRNYWKKIGIIQGFRDKWKLGPHGRKNTIWYVNFKKIKEVNYNENRRRTY
jgi:hypothetical protein